MIHNKYTSIQNGKLQSGRPHKPNYYSPANVTESAAFNMIFLVPLFPTDYPALQTHTALILLHTYTYNQPPPPCPRVSVCLSVPRLSAVSLPSLISSQLVPDFLFCSPQHKQAQWVIHTILKTVGATEKSNQPRPAWANYQCEIKSLRTGWLVIITTSEPNFICFCWVFFTRQDIILLHHHQNVFITVGGTSSVTQNTQIQTRVTGL